MRIRPMKAIFCFSIFCLSVSICACGGSGGDDDPTGPACSVEEENRIVYEVMKTTYLWYDQVPDTDYTAYDSPEALLEDLRYDFLDRWSYILPKAEYHAYSEEGRYVGSGYRLKFDADDNLRIAMVYAGSPADRAGMRRGDTILEVNGKTVAEISAADLWDTFGADDVGVSNRMTVQTGQNAPREIVLTKDWVTRHAVNYHAVLREGGHRIGYLVFSNFLAKAKADLDPVFAEFGSENVDALIVDLRYNQGGTADTTRYLASLIAGDAAKSTDLFASYLHNDTHTYMDEDQYFVDPQNELGPDTVVFITTGATCSASELVINGLEPYMNVASVGTQTCGKPVGMHGRDFCDKHISPVEFSVVNALGEGDYHWGLPPTCPAVDDLDHPLGDPREDSLARALDYVRNGECSENPDRTKPHAEPFEYVEGPDVGLIKKPRQ